MNNDEIIRQTRCWLEKVVIGCNFCPFAAHPFHNDRIRYSVCNHSSLEQCMHQVVNECITLDNNDNIETTLVIFSQAFARFDDYLDAVELAQQLLQQQGYEGVYQLASFHPHYCFADAEADDAANYTNRSPWPMIHLLREASIEKALQNVDRPEAIPERNIETARKLGVEAMQALLDSCRHK